MVLVKTEEIKRLIKENRKSTTPIALATIRGEPKTKREFIPQSVLHEMFLETGLTKKKAAHEAGFKDANSLFRDMLNENSTIDEIQYEVAAYFARAWNLEPIDYGL